MKTNGNPSLAGISILILDQSPTDLRNLKSVLTDYNANIFLADTTNSALKIIQNEQIHVILAELNLKEGSGLDLLDMYKNNFPEGLFYLMTNKASVETALESMKRGVTDYLEKPISPSEFAKKIESSIQIKSHFLERTDPLIEHLRRFFLFRSAIMRQTLMALPRFAATMQCVLITGETGTGKEMIARAIHSLSPLANGPFVALNCGAIPEGLIESELFGHEKGAFTGAHAIKKGKFELAQNGTLLLDEIGDMPLALQVRLLRVLEEGLIYRVGTEKPIPIRVRILAATRTRLEDAVEDGLFREDLYYRLNVLRLQLPPLRDRPDDISLLAWHFLNRAFDEIKHSKPYPYLAPDTIKILQSQPWKGNVRQLRNIMTRVAILLPYDTKQIFPIHVIPHLTDVAPITEVNIIPKQENNKDEISGVFLPVGTTIEEAENKLIQVTLEQTNGNKTHAAKILGIGLRTLRRKLNAE